MARRIVTRADVEAARGSGVLELGPDDVLTDSAREHASRSGVSLRQVSANKVPLSSAPQGHPLPSARPARAVVTLVGRNRPFVLSEITTRIAELNGNIEDITQRLVGDYFSTIVMVDLSQISQFGSFKADLEGLSREGDYRVVVQHERIFQAMHRI